MSSFQALNFSISNIKMHSSPWVLPVHSVCGSLDSYLPAEASVASQGADAVSGAAVHRSVPASGTGSLLGCCYRCSIALIFRI